VLDVAQLRPCATRTPPFLKPTNAMRLSKLSRLQFIATWDDPLITDPTGLCHFLLDSSGSRLIVCIPQKHQIGMACDAGTPRGLPWHDLDR
jgi:hypothetical protein